MATSIVFIEKLKTDLLYQIKRKYYALSVSNERIVMEITRHDTYKNYIKYECQHIQWILSNI